MTQPSVCFGLLNFGCFFFLQQLTNRSSANDQRVGGLPEFHIMQEPRGSTLAPQDRAEEVRPMRICRTKSPA